MKKSTISPKQTTKQNLLFLLFSAVSSFLLLMICTRSSFLYPMNDWTDAQCFFTVGKAMGNGQVVYKDIFEQKGVLLYFLHMLAYFVSHTTFLGVFILEVIAGTLFMFFNMKTITLYVHQIYAFLFAPMCSVMIYSSLAFDCGDSAEELCMPVFAFMFYLSAKAFKTDRYFSKKALITIGIVSGYVLWIKYTMLGFFIGWIIVPVIWLILKKQYSMIGKTFVFIALGVGIISLPIILYFLFNNAIGDLWTVYFYNNIFVYSTKTNFNEELSFIQCIYRNLYISMLDNKSFSVMIFIGLVGFLPLKGWQQKGHIYTCFAFLVFTIFGTSRYFGYYCIALSVFSVFGYVAVAVLTDKILHKIISADKFTNKTKFKIALQSLVVIMTISGTVFFAKSFGRNVYFMDYRQEDLPQYKLKEIICQEKNPTLLQFGGLDGGFYSVCDIVPNCKYFCGLNINLPEIGEGQQRYVDNGEGMFIVVRGGELHHDNYELVATEKFDDGHMERLYNLYRLKSIAKKE